MAKVVAFSAKSSPLLIIFVKVNGTIAFSIEPLPLVTLFSKVELEQPHFSFFALLVSKIG
jgi:hypothetical protein